MSKLSKYYALKGVKLRNRHGKVVITTATPNASIVSPRPGMFCVDKTGSTTYVCTAGPSTWAATTAL